MSGIAKNRRHRADSKRRSLKTCRFNDALDLLALIKQFFTASKDRHSRLDAAPILKPTLTALRAGFEEARVRPFKQANRGAAIRTILASPGHVLKIAR